MRQKGASHSHIHIQKKLGIKNKALWPNIDVFIVHFGKGVVEELSEIEQLKLKNKQLSVETEILKKYRENRKEMVPESVIELVNCLKEKCPIKLICECLNVQGHKLEDIWL